MVSSRNPGCAIRALDHTAPHQGHESCLAIHSRILVSTSRCRICSEDPSWGNIVMAHPTVVGVYSEAQQTAIIMQNFGCPCYEGNGRQASYDSINLPICEELYTTTDAIAPSGIIGSKKRTQVMCSPRTNVCFTQNQRQEPRRQQIALQRRESSRTARAPVADGHKGARPAEDNGTLRQILTNWN